MQLGSKGTLEVGIFGSFLSFYNCHRGSPFISKLFSLVGGPYLKDPVLLQELTEVFEKKYAVFGNTRKSLTACRQNGFPQVIV